MPGCSPSGETTPYNGHWPQVTIIWEIDAFADYARIGRAQARRWQPSRGGGPGRSTCRAWGDGEGRIMYAGKYNKTWPSCARPISVPDW